jgi:hypothetical protein
LQRLFTEILPIYIDKNIIGMVTFEYKKYIADGGAALISNGFPRARSGIR